MSQPIAQTEMIDSRPASNPMAALIDVRERDARDMARSVAPLRQNADAHLLDTTGISAEQATERVLAWFRG